jgi:hypothetical protein
MQNRLAMWFGFPQEERTMAAFNSRRALLTTFVLKIGKFDARKYT